MTLPTVASHVRTSLLGLAASLAISAPALAFQVGPGCSPDLFEPNDDCTTPANHQAGLLPGLTLTAGEVDVHRIFVAPGQRLDVTLTLLNPDPAFIGTARLVVDDGSPTTCDTSSNQLALRFLASAQPVTTMSWTTSPSSGVAFLVELQDFSNLCTTYDLDLTVTPDTCATLAPDALEDNDTCATATPIGVGSFPGLNVSLHDPDVYLLSAAAAELLTVRVDVSTPGAVVDLAAWPLLSPCGSLVVATAGAVVQGGTPGGLYLFDDTGVPRTYVLVVQTSTVGSFTPEFCADYALQVSSTTNPCGLVPGDPFEPNTDCISAPPLTSSQTGLSIHAGGDQDFYTIDVPPRSTVRLRSTPSAPAEERDMMLWASCNLDTSQFLASSAPFDFVATERRQWLQWSNTTNVPVSVRLLVTAPFGFFPNAFCDVYDLDLGFTKGEPFCIATRNASGEAARLTASGSTTVGQGVLTLVAAPVPSVTTGLVFLGSSSTPPQPFGYGYRCVAGPIVRLPVTSTTTGALTTTVDWTGAASVVTPGSTWSFQAWFRDTSGGVPGFNTSEGLRVSFP